MNQKVKLQISSDIEDVARVSSVLLEEALIDVTELENLISAAKISLRELNLGNPEDLPKLQTCLQFLGSTRDAMIKIDNRLADVVAIVDGLDRLVNKSSEESSEPKEEVKDDNVVAG
jgi:hypothetical protein